MTARMTTEVAEVAARLAQVRARIERACGRAGGDPARVEIVAVTKGQPVEACRAALAAGLTTLAENRVQEALPKMEAVPEAAWHLVGHLQLNKVRHTRRFAMIQSLDSLRLAEALAARGGASVLLEVNVSREPQKHGAPVERALDLAARVAGLLELRGLMGIAPLGRDPRPAFGTLRRLRDEAEQRLGHRLPILSMGMTDDFEAAVQEGSTMVRLGRALFP